MFYQPAVPRCEQTELLRAVANWEKAFRVPRLTLPYSDCPEIQSDRHFYMGLECALCVLVFPCVHTAVVSCYCWKQPGLCVPPSFSSILLLLLQQSEGAAHLAWVICWLWAPSLPTARTQAAPASQGTAPLSLPSLPPSQNTGTPLFKAGEAPHWTQRDAHGLEINLWTNVSKSRLFPHSQHSLRRQTDTI